MEIYHCNATEILIMKDASQKELIQNNEGFKFIKYKTFLVVLVLINMSFSF